MPTDILRLRMFSLTVTVFAAVALIAGLLQLVLLGKEIFFPEPPVIEVIATGQNYTPGGIDESHLDNLTDEQIAILEQIEAERARDGDSYISMADADLAPIEKRPLGERVLNFIGKPEGIAMIVMLIAFIAFFIAALMWVWRAHSNLAIRGIHLKITPWRAVINYLIPMFNLVFPFEAMRELYNRSEGEPEELADSSVWQFYDGALQRLS